MHRRRRRAALKADRVMADDSWLMALSRQPSAMTISHQPLAMAEVRDLMWRDAGLFRSREGLTRAVRALNEAASTPIDDPRLRNLITVARLIARAALRREESRGGHFRSDFPARDDRRWKCHLVDAGATG